MCRHCVERIASGSARSNAGRAAWFAGVAALTLLMAGCGSLPFVNSDRGKREESSAAAEPALPAEAVQQFERAVTLMSSGDLAGAERDFRALADAYPSYSGPLLNLGILHAKAGKLEQAEQLVRDAIARNGNNAAAYNQLGIIYRKLGRFEEADQAYTRAVQIDPNYALAYLNLGVLCDLYLQEPERALQAYERYMALASEPDAQVSTWISELKKRIGTEPRSASTAE